MSASPASQNGFEFSAEPGRLLVRILSVINHSHMSREQRQRAGHIRNVRAQLEPSEAHNLLNVLCVRYGFCLSPEASERLTDSPPIYSDEFTAAVLEADGFAFHKSDPLTRSMRETVAKAFHAHNLK